LRPRRRGRAVWPGVRSRALPLDRLLRGRALLDRVLRRPRWALVPALRRRRLRRLRRLRQSRV
ncbi:hypothetical protein, partial [Saccharomonospora azurea]|uniref:hypothetical protein n=1 Tax=Saccharomonospora azurea TaxID=40988 RepID=UPI001C3F8C0B